MKPNNKFLSVIAFLCVLGAFQNEAAADELVYVVVTGVKVASNYSDDDKHLNIKGEAIVGGSTIQVTQKLYHPKPEELRECGKLALMSLSRPGRYRLHLEFRNWGGLESCELQLVQN